MIVIGDYIYDEYLFGTCKRMSPEAPVPVIENYKSVIKAGGAANVVANLKAFGKNLKFIQNPDQRTVKRRIFADNHLVCRIDEEQYIPFHIEFDFSLSEHKTAILSDYNKGVIDEPQYIINKLNNNDIDVFVDPKKEFRRYAHSFLIKANKQEFEKEIGTEYSDSTAANHCRELCNQYNFCAIVITLGGNGCYVYDHLLHKGIRIHSENKTVLDVTGAGDVFMAALAHYYELEYPIVDAAYLANELAGISVGHIGTYVLTEDDILSVEKKNRTEIVVFTNGCFDILHPGHIHLLKESKKLGDRLIVGLNSDHSIRKLKGADRPILKQDQRKKMLEALDIADEVIIFETETPRDLINKIRPDIITKGGDYVPETVVGHDLAKVVIIPTLENYSTTGVINAIKR